MARTKNKKSKLAETYANKRKQQLTKKTLSPFEVHVNKDKQKVLGKKSKADQGLPGVARTKAIAKRKVTLLQEYKVKDKDNIFLDRRIGEKNYGMSEEDKAMARFAAERVKAHKKKDIFNLNDDEVLTHRGQSLIEVEKYDDPRSDDDEDDDANKTGKLDKYFVEDAHFGGGLLSKPDSEMSRKDLINQLIAESKKRKAEKQKIREQTIDLTAKLDSEWRDLLPLVASSNKAVEDTEEQPKADDYDIAMRQLKFEARGVPTDKLRSEEEIAKEEKAKLEKLEEDRLARMQGFSDETEFQKKHKSADDLDDFHIERIEEPSDNEDDQKGILVNKINENGIAEPEEDIGDDGEEENENEDDEDEDDDDNSEEKESSRSDEENESGEESEDDFSDLKASDSSEDEEDIENTDINKQNTIQITKEIVNTKTETLNKNKIEKKLIGDLTEQKESSETISIGTIDDGVSKSTENTESHVNMREREAMMEKARKELPYTFTVPETYKELLTLFKDRNPDYQSVIVERIIKCNHWKLAGGNKEKLVNLFSFLLKYLNDCASVKNLKGLENFFEIFDRLCPHLYDLAHADPTATKDCLHDILKEKHDQFENRIKVYPELDTVRQHFYSKIN